METKKISTGIAGEYFVAGELSRRGFIASLTLKNTTGIDILASNGEKSINIQVKTRLADKTGGWNLGSKPLDYTSDHNSIFYVLVEASSDQKDKTINYYIIPKKELNEIVEKEHLAWMSGTQKSGKARKSEMRFLWIKKHTELEKYRDNWGILFI